jgi:hypothetical protein
MPPMSCFVIFYRSSCMRKSVRREQWFMAENENDTCGENLSTVNQQRGMSQKLKCEREQN